MVEIIACKCNLGIPGVEQLPPHTHIGVQHKVRWKNGRVSVVPDHMLGMNPDQNRCEVLETYPESIRIWVPWKAVARAISVVSPPHGEVATHEEEVQARRGASTA